MSILNILLIFTSRQFSNHSIYSADKILWVGSSTLCRGVDTDEFSLSISGLQVISSATIDAKYDMRKKSLLPQTANYNRFSWIWKTIASSFINAHEGLFSNNIRVRLVWASLAPPNVETFTWKFMWERVPTKVELIKRDYGATGVLYERRPRPLNFSGGSKSWLAPSEDTLKFNTDATVREISGYQILPGAEILAILEACTIAKGSPWIASHSFFSESDCSLVVDWILDGNHIPNIFFKDIDKVRQMGQTFPFKFQAIDREADDAADKLAREAIDRAYPFIWMDVSSSNVGFGSNLCTSSHGR
ncbi:hypothetical protein V6N12_028507 [Hibiscus sabdariffa]|uniref:RNase H type-1 domain-containing protein n=1 Tax=Hibiscus sabdariffa TaxID=183260 RepID=A0ABR2F624_9ROSI